MKTLIYSILFFFFLTGGINAQPQLERVEPAFWWANMNNPKLQLMIHGENIAETTVHINYQGVDIVSLSKVENPNYLFVDLRLATTVIPGVFDIDFNFNGETVFSYQYELKKRKSGSSQRIGFNTSDAIYLITPDRFVNGDTSNDALESMKEKPNRNNRDGRHGGDIRGIINSLDYIEGLGFTAVWLNPVLENNMTGVSYHGYSTTDFYKVDARYGSNEEYLELSEELEKRGMKLIMDMIFNHCGSEHWWMEDMPMKDWINNYPEYKITSHRRTINQDPHASETDKIAMSDGWFVPTMPDLNQRNSFMSTYLIQNSIWWIEYAGLGGIRQDTWPYPDKNMMTEWTRCVLEEYPRFNIVGEEWSMNPAIVSYWQKGKINSDGYECFLPSLMDFPLQNAVSQGLSEKEGWGEGLIKIYEALANDFLYSDPDNLVVFPDNHDMSRFYVQVGENKELLKLGLAFFLTTRGIPQIYYGTEILMKHPGSHHGDIRAEFPGGWTDSKVNAFTGKGLSADQIELLDYVRTIQNWRKYNTVIHTGELKHFVPEKGMYVYFRYNKTKTVMVVLNKNEQDSELATDRFNEIISGYTSGKDIVSGKNIGITPIIKVPALSAMIIELGN